MRAVSETPMSEGVGADGVGAGMGEAKLVRRGLASTREAAATVGTVGGTSGPDGLVGTGAAAMATVAVGSFGGTPG